MDTVLFEGAMSSNTDMDCLINKIPARQPIIGEFDQIDTQQFGGFPSNTNEYMPQLNSQQPIQTQETYPTTTQHIATSHIQQRNVSTQPQLQQPQQHPQQTPHLQPQPQPQPQQTPQPQPQPQQTPQTQPQPQPQQTPQIQPQPQLQQTSQQPQPHTRSPPQTQQLTKPLVNLHTNNILDNIKFTSFMGYKIPTNTLYFIIVIIIIACGLYYFTSNDNKKSKPVNKEN
jgi:hypothetical protein